MGNSYSSNKVSKPIPEETLRKLSLILGCHDILNDKNSQVKMNEFLSGRRKRKKKRNI